MSSSGTPLALPKFLGFFYNYCYYFCNKKTFLTNDIVSFEYLGPDKYFEIFLVKMVVNSKLHVRVQYSRLSLS